MKLLIEHIIDIKKLVIAPVQSEDVSFQQNISSVLYSLRTSGPNKSPDVFIYLFTTSHVVIFTSLYPPATPLQKPRAIPRTSG